MLFSCIQLPYFDSDTPGQKRTAKMGAWGAPKRKKKKQNKGVMLTSNQWSTYNTADFRLIIYHDLKTTRNDTCTLYIGKLHALVSMLKP